MVAWKLNDWSGFLRTHFTSTLWTVAATSSCRIINNPWTIIPILHTRRPHTSYCLSTHLHLLHITHGHEIASCIIKTPNASWVISTIITKLTPTYKISYSVIRASKLLFYYATTCWLIIYYLQVTMMMIWGMSVCESLQKCRVFKKRFFCDNKQ